MKGIQNKLIISQKTFTQLQKRNYQNFFEYVTFSVNFSLGCLDCTTNIQTIFNLVPGCLKHVWCYRSLCIPYVGFQVLQVVDLNLIDSVLHITEGKNLMGLNLVT
jgi:hypothetical protein